MLLDLYHMPACWDCCPNKCPLSQPNGTTSWQAYCLVLKWLGLLSWQTSRLADLRGWTAGKSTAKCQGDFSPKTSPPCSMNGYVLQALCTVPLSFSLSHLIHCVSYLSLATAPHPSGLCVHHSSVGVKVIVVVPSCPHISPTHTSHLKFQK